MRREALAIPPGSMRPIWTAPLSRPLPHNGKQSAVRRPMHPDAIDRVLAGMPPRSA
jgi:hypothetical protein